MTHLLRQQPLLGLSQWGTGPNKQKQPLSLFWGGRDLLRSNNRLPGKLGKAASFGNSSGGERGAVFFLQRGTAQQILSLGFGWHWDIRIIHRSLALWLLQKKSKVSLCEIGLRAEKKGLSRVRSTADFSSLCREEEEPPQPPLFSPFFLPSSPPLRTWGEACKKGTSPPPA